MIEQVLSWEWRDANTLWFLLAPLGWALLAWWFRRRQTNQYADAALMPWVQTDAQHSAGFLASFIQLFNPSKITKKAEKSTRPGRFWRFFAQKMPAKVLQPAWMLSLAWFCLIIALAGPRTLVPAPDESSRAGVDILVAMDASRSMMIQDVAPNRFLQARALLESFKNRLEPNDRLGLMAFAGKPHLVVPLTFDRNLFQHYSTLVRPGMLPTHGSQLNEALLFGHEHLQQTAGKARVLIVFTNGEPPAEQMSEAQTPLQALADDKDTKVILVGVGQNKLRNIPNLKSPPGWVKEKGLLVRSRLEEASLRKLAADTNGTYLAASNDAAFMKTLLEAVALTAEKRTFEFSQPVWQDHAMPFILLGIWALLWAFFPIRIWRTAGLNSIGLALVAGVLMNGAMVDSAWANSAVGLEKQAYQAFKQNEFDDAVATYETLSHYAGWMGAGAAAYRQQDYESSVLYFREAALMGFEDAERAKALFNLANSFYMANLLPQAIESYEQALVYQPDYEKALVNLAIAKQRAEQEKGSRQAGDAQGEGQGSGNSNQEGDGAMYGGQKPNSDAGEGVSGDSLEGEKEGQQVVVPDSELKTDYSLNRNRDLKVGSSGNAILDQQQRIRRIEKFEHDMKRIADNQGKLLKRLFEREEDFQAVQEEVHERPGVKPW